MWIIRTFLVSLMMIGNAMAADLIVKDSADSVEETVSRLTAAVEKAGATLFAVVDHKKGADKVGQELAPATLVIFGNPAIGTPIMQNAIQAGIDLPLRVLVYEEGRATKIAYLDPAALKARYGIDGADEAFAKMTGALKKLTDVAAGS